MEEGGAGGERSKTALAYTVSPEGENGGRGRICTYAHTLLKLKATREKYGERGRKEAGRGGGVRIEEGDEEEE